MSAGRNTVAQVPSAITRPSPARTTTTSSSITPITKSARRASPAPPCGRATSGHRRGAARRGDTQHERHPDGEHQRDPGQPQRGRQPGDDRRPPVARSATTRRDRRGTARRPSGRTRGQRIVEPQLVASGGHAAGLGSATPRASSTRRAGSPGVTASMPNTISPAPARVITAWPSRRRNGRTSAVGRRHRGRIHPEVRDRHLEAAPLRAGHDGLHAHTQVADVSCRRRGSGSAAAGRRARWRRARPQPGRSSRPAPDRRSR